MKVNISELRTRITFQQPTQTTDEGGAQITSWANVTATPTVWARWINEHGQEALQSDTARSAQRAIVTVRYRADVDANWRILKDGQAWQIISDPDDIQYQHKWLEMAVERVKGAVSP